MVQHTLSSIFTFKNSGVAIAVFLVAALFTGGSISAIRSIGNDEPADIVAKPQHQTKASTYTSGIVTQPMIFNDNNNSDSSDSQGTANNSSDSTTDVNFSASTNFDSTEPQKTPVRTATLTINDVEVPIEPNKNISKTIIDDDSRVSVRIRDRQGSTGSNSSVHISVKSN